MEIAPLLNSVASAAANAAAVAASASPSIQQKQHHPPQQQQQHYQHHKQLTTKTTTTTTTTATRVNAAAITTYKSSAGSAGGSGSGVTVNTLNVNQNDNVNNLAILASLTLQKVLNINNINNQRNDSSAAAVVEGSPYQHKPLKEHHQHKQQQQQQQQQQQHPQQKKQRNSDNEDENDVLNKLLKTGAIFTKTGNNKNGNATATTTATTITLTATKTTASAPIAIERKRNQVNGVQKQRLNSSISSTNSATSTSTNSSSTGTSYGSANIFHNNAAAAAATDSSNASGNEDAVGKYFNGATPKTKTSKTSSSSSSRAAHFREKSKIPSDILDDLASRFIINVPDMELNNLIRICFQIELAHWFYIDFFCAPAPSESAEDDEDNDAIVAPVQRKLPIVGIKQFAMQLFQHIPFLNKHFGTVDKILEEWKNYKLSVPTYGAILVSEDLDHCLLVQSYFAKNSWGFPKGKINENEDPAHCATREVYEETGFDITEKINGNDYIEAFINYQYTRLYIVRNIPLDTPFAPRTRNEIKCCDWFRIDSLPVNKNDVISKAKLGKNLNSFFMIIPFVKRLKKWVSDRRAGIEAPRRRKCSGQQSPKALSPMLNINTNNTNLNVNNNCNQKHLQFACKKDLPVVVDQQQARRRQRHKSMGDLDGVVKLNNLNKQAANDQLNTTTPALTTTTTTTMVDTTPKGSGKRNNNSNINNINNSNNKQLNVAAGSNKTNPQQQQQQQLQQQQQQLIINGNLPGGLVQTPLLNPGMHQLYHRSQSQTDTQQPTKSNEKIVSSFDLIRKEKQQLKAATKAQKQQQQQQQQQQQNCQKTQNDKQLPQQQQQQQPLQQIYQNKICANGGGGGNGYKTPTQQVQQQHTPTSGMDWIAMIGAAAAAQNTPQQQPQQQQQQQQQRPRPASVSLNFNGTPPIITTVTTTVGKETQKDAQKLSSGSNIRILKRAQSHQPVALQQQQQQQEPQQPEQLTTTTTTSSSTPGPELNFTPNFNSWTNFSFTKNFIANVFC